MLFKFVISWDICLVFIAVITEDGVLGWDGIGVSI